MTRPAGYPSAMGQPARDVTGRASEPFAHLATSLGAGPISAGAIADRTFLHDIDSEPNTRAREAHFVCPYLLAADGNWRRAAPVQDHRCSAVDPPPAVARDKQRRLCLVAAHRTCSTFQAARSASLEVSTAAGRPIPRTVPLVLDRPRPSLHWASAGGVVRGRAALVAVMATAFVVLAIARLSGPAGALEGGVAAVTGTPRPTTSFSRLPVIVVAPSLEIVSPSPVIAASEVPLPSPTLPPPTLPPSPIPSIEPPPVTPPPSAAATDPPATAPPTSAPGATRQYTVRSGDTMYNIANFFGTSITAIQELNGISDPRLIRVGQVLLLP